jgi:hypothetical protein
MMDLIETGCGDFDAVHSVIDHSILVAYESREAELDSEEEI